MDITIEFVIFELVKVPNFSLNWQFCFFGLKSSQKGYFSLKQKIEHYHWIPHIRISLGTKFQVKLTIFIFWSKLAQNRYHWSKTEKVNSTIKFCVFQLVWIPQLKFKMLIFWTKFACGPWLLLTISNFSARWPTNTTAFWCLFSF